MTNPPENTRSFDWPRHLPWILFAFAFAIRLIGIGWGLPNKDRYWSYHPDEPVNLMYARQINVGAGDFDPNFYNYGTLYLTLSSIGDKVVSSYSPLPENPTREQMAAQDAKSTLVGRLISALAGAGTALLVFFMLRRWQGPFVSAMGAMLVAVAPGHVVHSRFMTVDVFATFLIAASLYAAFRMIPAKDQPIDDLSLHSWKWPIWAGIFAGLSAGTKYNGVLVLLALFVVLAMARPAAAMLKGIAATICSIVAFFIATPGALTNTEKFKTDLAYELSHSRTGHGLVFEGMPGSGFVQILNLAIGVGVLISLFSIAGLAWGAKNRSIPILATLAFSVAYYIVLSRAEIAFLRYTFPLYIGLGIGLGWFLGEIQNFPKVAKGFTASAIAFLGGIPFGDSLMLTGRQATYMAGTDPRDAVVEYFQNQKDQKPVTVGVVADPWFYSPPYFPDATAPRFLPAEIRHQGIIEGPFASPARPVIYVPTGEPKFDWDARLITETKPDYIVFSSFEMIDLERLKDRTDLRPEVKLQVDRYKQFIAELGKSYDFPKWVFYAGAFGSTVHDMEYIRPQLWVWKRKPTP